MTLREGKVSKKYEVVGFNTGSFDVISRFYHLGIIEGVILKIVQKKPVIVIEVYHTRFALDENLAGFLKVEELTL